MHPTRRLTASFAALVLLASSLAAHDGDPKLRDRRPMYPGRGWKNHQRLGDDGNLLSTGPALRFPKNNVTLLSWLSLSDLGVPAGGNGNSCFGYTSPSGREYAVIGTSRGTTFVEVTQPGNPVIVGTIVGPTSLWRDVRTYSHYSYSVSEGGSGIQVVDLNNIDNGVVTLVNTVNDDGTSATHTIAINPTSGYLYRSGGGSQGLRIYNLNPNPAAPARVGTWSARYSHEVSVFSYTSGPAAGKEIAYVCGGLNGGFTSTGLYVVDVTNKAVPVQLQYVTYVNASFCHQGWPSPDMHYFYIDDELDDGPGTSCVTRVFDISNPLAVVQVAGSGGTFTNGNSSIDHNQYTRGNQILQSNYRSGLRVQSTSNPGTQTAPVEVGYFDTWPEDNATLFNGLWNNYPYFPSGTVIGSDIEKGLFVWWVGAPPLAISLLSGDTDTVAPGGHPVSVQITPAGQLVAGTAKLHYDIGSGWTSVDLVTQGGDVYGASLPPAPCGTVVRYYFSAQSTNGVVWSEPEAAPEVFHQAVAAASLGGAFSDDFESNQGWTAGAAGDTASAGVWVRVDPSPSSAQTGDDHTSGAGTTCWVTGSSSDVDGGRTTLTSPVYDLSSLAEPVVRYWRWYSDSYSPTETDGETLWDVFRVEVSANNGGSWAPVETVGPAGLECLGGWIFHQFHVADYVPPSSQTRVRFIAQDLGTDSTIEAAVDDFSIVDATCSGAEPYCFGDGSIEDCPCQNFGAQGHGCENSSFTGGAILTFAGNPSVSADSFVLTSSGERPTVLSLFMQGDAQVSAVTYGDGLRCTGGVLKRLYAKVGVAGSVTAPTGGDPSITTRSAALGDPIGAFETRCYQVFYRDSNLAYCPSPGGDAFNVSSALRVIWGP